MHDQNAGSLPADRLDEPPGDHGGDQRLAQADHVRQHGSVVLHHHPVSLDGRIPLVFEIHDPRRQLRGEVLLHLIAEMFDEHFHVELVGRGPTAQVRAAQDRLEVGLRQGLPFLPEAFEFVGAEFDVVIVLHGDVELIARRTGRPEPRLRNVGRAHDHPPVAVGRMFGGQTQVELGVQVLAGVYPHFQAPGTGVLHHPQDALIRPAVRLGRADIAGALPHVHLFGLPDRGVVQQEKQLPAAVRVESVHVDARQNLDLDVRRQRLPQPQVPGPAEEAAHRVKELEALHVLPYPFEFFVKGISLSVGEEFGAHAACGVGRPRPPRFHPRGTRPGAGARALPQK